MPFNAACPTCNGPVDITMFTVSCEMTIKESGWTVMATHRNTNGTEMFSCRKCDVTVPSSWVYKEMSVTEAQRLMKEWGANVYSIHNRKPLPAEPEEKKQDGEGRRTDPEAELQSA